MYLKQLTISNYKSFFKPQALNFEPGFNVLLGANSSGKTSILEAIEFHAVQNITHRSLLNVVDRDYVEHGATEVSAQFELSFKEIHRVFSTTGEFWLPIGTEDGINFHCQDTGVLKEKFESEKLHLDLSHSHKTGQKMRIGISGWPTPWLPLGGGVSYLGARYAFTDQLFDNVTNIGQGPQLQQTLWSMVTPKIYRFSAERSVLATCGHVGNGELSPKSENLAFCMNHLQTTNPALFDELTTYIKRVFPSIHRISAPPSNSQFELRVQTTDPKLNRAELAVSIDKVGTGVGNALAMLYVALTAQTQRFILLEEPNSYLHPRALRELLAILAEIGSKHQFFVTTHSSDVLRTIKASTVTLLEHDGCQTTVKQTSGNELHKFQAGLVDLGIRLTDLHGCDKVLWVEGETEEAIFPLLLKHYFPELAQGIAVLPLHATGDFEAKKYEPKKVADIYKKLSQGSFLAPPMVAIALDKERRKDSEVKQVEADCAGIVYFLPRTMLEDYLLNPEAIAAVLSQELGRIVAQVDVEKAFDEASASPSCLLKPENKADRAIHAAKVLKSVFDSVGTLEYRKTAHGPKIAEWLLSNKPDEFVELHEWFNKFLLKSA